MPILTRATPIPKTQEDYYEFLNAHYPSLFNNCFPDAAVPLGWHKIILFLCEQTQRLICGYRLPPNVLFFDQIKEKFGGLRVYFTIEVDRNQEGVVEDLSLLENIDHFRHHIYDLVSVVEGMANKTCTSCGEDNQPVTQSSFGTYCQSCWQLINSQRKKDFIP